MLTVRLHVSQEQTDRYLLGSITTAMIENGHDLVPNLDTHIHVL